MIINNRKIGPKEPPYIIAEMSANHNGSLQQAFQIIDSAILNGADAVKIQTYTADTITLNSSREDFIIDSGPWKGQTLFDLYSKSYTPWEWHKPIFDYAKEKDFTIFSSPFDFTAIDFLEDLGAPAYKIASFEAIDLPLIKYCASTKKPMIISTGMASRIQIEEAIDAAREGGCQDIAILHCVSGYPAPVEDYNLNTIPDMIKHFNVTTGLSDHTIGISTAISSVALGGCIIEKHFTLNSKAGGSDDFFSIEPKGLKDLTRGVLDTWKSLGKVNYSIKDSELVNIKFRRSLYYVKEIKKGEIITEDSVRSVRPGYGLEPKMIYQVIGKRAARDIERNSAVTFESFVGWLTD